MCNPSSSPALFALFAVSVLAIALILWGIPARYYAKGAAQD
ncbi:MAG: hypothetical protein ACRER8_20645 [Pseudomonas sp.]